MFVPVGFDSWFQNVHPFYSFFCYSCCCCLLSVSAQIVCSSAQRRTCGVVYSHMTMEEKLPAENRMLVSVLLFFVILCNVMVLGRGRWNGVSDGKKFCFFVVCGWWVVSLVYLLVGFYLWVWAIFYIALLVLASGFMGLWFILKKNVFSLEIYPWWLYWLKICCKFFWIVIVSLLALGSGFCWIYLISFWFCLMGFWYPTKENAGKVGRVIFLILWRLIYGGLIS